MMRRDTMEEKRINLEKSPLESGEARRRETAQEPPLCPATVTLNIESTENVTWMEGRGAFVLNHKFCYWSEVVMWLIWVGETRFYSNRLWYIMPVRYIKLGHQIPSWVTTKKWNPLLNPSQWQLDVSQTLVSRHPEKSLSDNTGKYHKTSLKGVWFFYKFFIFWSLFLAQNILLHVPSRALTPGCICWKEAKGTQPVVDGDNNQVLVHQHLRSETGIFKLTWEMKPVWNRDLYFDLRKREIPNFEDLGFLCS